MLQAFAAAIPAHRLCGNHFRTNSSGNCVCVYVEGKESAFSSAAWRCCRVEEVWLCTINPCNCCEMLLSCSIYYYVKLKSAWFPAVSACAQGLVSIVTNTKDCAGAVLQSCVSVFRSSVQSCMSIWLMTNKQSEGFGCHCYSSSTVCLGMYTEV